MPEQLEFDLLLDILACPHGVTGATYDLIVEASVCVDAAPPAPCHDTRTLHQLVEDNHAGTTPVQSARK